LLTSAYQLPAAGKLNGDAQDGNSRLRTPTESRELAAMAPGSYRSHRRTVS